MENNYWIDLIGFDVNDKEKSLQDFINKQQVKVDSLILHIPHADFFLDYHGMDSEYNLSEQDCAGFDYSDERARQVWTNYDLKEFVDICHKHNIKIMPSISGTGSGKYGKEHKELHCISTRIAMDWHSYYFIKRYKDGTYFEDYVNAQFKWVLTDYNFDGVLIADIVTFTHTRIVNDDYTDDLVEQFVNRTGIKIPFKITNTTIKEQQARYRYIVKNLRVEWSKFKSERYGEFISKLIKTIHSLGKVAYLVNAWTCSPFEGLYRFGIDYRQYTNAGADAWMYEDAIGINISGWRNVEYELDDFQRHNWMRRLAEKQGALKSCSNSTKIVNMTSIHDTHEQWNLIDNAPNEFTSSIAKRSTIYYWKDGTLIPSCEGSIFCLSDCVKKESWDRIHTTIKDYEIGNPIDTLSFTTLYDDDLFAQLKEFIATRRHNTEYLDYRFSVAGLPIAAYATKEELPKSRGPLLICAEAVRDAKTKEYLENTDRLTIIAGYKKVLDKKPCSTFKCGDFTAYVYNCTAKVNKSYTGYKKAALHYQDPVNAHWPILLRTDKINPNLFADLVKSINPDCLPYGVMPYELKDERTKSMYPKSYKKGDYLIFTFKMSDKHYRMVIQNFDNNFVHPRIKFPYPVDKVKVVGMPEWYATTLVDGCIAVTVNNRSSMLLDVYTK